MGTNGDKWGYKCGYSGCSGYVGSRWELLCHGYDLGENGYIVGIACGYNGNVMGISGGRKICGSGDRL